MPPPRRPQPAVAATTSRHQQLLAAALSPPPPPPPPPHGKAIAAPLLPEDINDDDEDPNKWLNTGATDSLFMPNMEEPYRVREDDQNARTKTCTRLDFHGALEETPPDAGAAVPKVNPGNIFSPNTLQKVTDEELAAGGHIEKKKHHRKRSKKDKPSVSQRPASPKRPRVQDDLMSQPTKGTLQGRSTKLENRL